MLYNKLLEIGVPADWRLMTDEYKALALGAFVVVAILVWNRIRIWKRLRTIETRLDRIETQLSKMQNEINTVLQIQVSLIAQLNPKSRMKLDPSNAAVEMGGGDVAESTISPPTTPAQPESANR
jgi:type II secretory pathway component PulM